MRSSVRPLRISFLYYKQSYTVARAIIALSLILTFPIVALIILLFGLCKVIGKGPLIPTISISVSTIYLLLILRPATTAIQPVHALLNTLGGIDSFGANIIHTLVPSIFLAVIFKGDTKKFSFVLSAMIITALAINITNPSSYFSKAAENKWAKWHKYEGIKLAKKPNIFFIVPDSYGSMNLLRDLNINTTNFQQFLTDQKFKIYDETFSSYQNTLNSMPAFLNMEHHYHTITADNDTEVIKSARVIAAGNNNFFRVLGNNGYTRQNIHQRTYLFLHGHNVDYCYPSINEYAGAKIVLGRIFNRNLLTDKEKSRKDIGVEKVHQEAIAQLSKNNSKPIVQYIHIFSPEHSPNDKQGKCDEQLEVQRYADRINIANSNLQNFINDIINRDPDAVNVLAGDHGPYMLNECRRGYTMTTAKQIRDRVGIFSAIRWPEGYDGRYDHKIKTSVNLLRYILASLAENETAVLKTTVSDDVYAAMKTTENKGAFFKVIEEGNILTKAKLLQVPESLRDAQ